MLQRDTLHQDVLTLDGGNSLRQEHLAIVLHTIIDTLSQRLFTIASGLLNIKSLLLIILINLTIGRGTDKFSMTRQGYVLSPMSIDTGTKRVYLDALVTSEYYWHVVLDETAEVQLGTIVKLQIDIALQLNATRLPLTSGNNDSATTQFRQLVDSGLDSLAILGSMLILGSDAFLQFYRHLTGIKLVMVNGCYLKLKGGFYRSNILRHGLWSHLTTGRHMQISRNLRHA